MTLKRGVLRGLLGVAVLALIYCAYSYAGPYRWLAELSLSTFGSYDPRFVFFGALVVLLVPPALLIARFDPSPATTDAVQAAARNTVRMARVQPWLLLAGLGAMLLFLGGRALLEARAGATLTKISCASIEAGSRPAGSWLEISGAAIREAAVETSEGYGKHLYVPLVSDNWSKATPLPVVLVMDATKPHDLGAASFQGALSSEDLPGMVRAAYEAEGVQADKTIVLQLGRIPNANVATSQIMTAIGLVAFLFGAIMIRRKWNEAGA